MADTQTLQPEDLVRHVKRLLREARQYVADAGSDEDDEIRSNAAALLVEIDKVLYGQ